MRPRWHLGDFGGHRVRAQGVGHRSGNDPRRDGVDAHFGETDSFAAALVTPKITALAAL